MYRYKVGLLLILYIIIILFSPILINNLQANITLFVNVLFPSLFLLFVTTSTLNYYGCFNALYNHLPFFLKYLFYPIMALILGFNGNVLYLNHQALNENMKAKIIYSYACPSLAFMLFTIGKLLNNYHIALYILGIQFFSSFILFIFLGFKAPFALKTKHYALKLSLEKAIKDSGYAFYMMLGYILIINAFKTDLFINCLLEFSSAINNIIKSTLPINNKVLSINLILSFSSLSAHLQVFNLSKCALSYPKYLYYRIINCLLSLLIFLITYRIFL